MKSVTIPALAAILSVVSAVPFGPIPIEPAWFTPGTSPGINTHAPTHTTAGKTATPYVFNRDQYSSGPASGAAPQYSGAAPQYSGSAPQYSGFPYANAQTSSIYNNVTPSSGNSQYSGDSQYPSTTEYLSSSETSSSAQYDSPSPFSQSSILLPTYSHYTPSTQSLTPNAAYGKIYGSGSNGAYAPTYGPSGSTSQSSNADVNVTTILTFSFTEDIGGQTCEFYLYLDASATVSGSGSFDVFVAAALDASSTEPTYYSAYNLDSPAYTSATGSAYDPVYTPASGLGYAPSGKSQGSPYTGGSTYGGNLDGSSAAKQYLGRMSAVQNGEATYLSGAQGQNMAFQCPVGVYAVELVAVDEDDIEWYPANGAGAYIKHY